MEKILTDFGVQPIYLSAQVVNFTILFLILKKFLYKPILKVLEDRKKTVSESLLNAEKIEEQLHATEQQAAAKLAEVKKQAHTLLEKALSTADQIIADAHKKAQTDVDGMIEQGKQSISVDREAMKRQMQDELEGLVLSGIESIAGKVLDQHGHKVIVDNVINRLKEQI